jgi:hypothetical protein
VLETSTLPYDPKRLVVSVGSLSGEPEHPFQAKPGQSSIYDYEYIRKG